MCGFRKQKKPILKIKKPMKTIVALENLRFRARHGVSPQERAVGNDFIVTVRLRYPFQKAMDADTLADTLNYAEAYDIIKAEMAIPSSLIEHVAGRIRSALLARFPLIEGGMVRVEKANPPIAGMTGTAAAEIEW